jgi:type 1 glutamine amidotransferase
MRAQLLFVLAGMAITAHAQRILHFTATSGFDHQTRAVSFALFQDIAAAHGWDVVDDATGAHFSDAADLGTFVAVIFSNTTGDAILTEAQRANFEVWVEAGGRVLGIHSASDTYRHSTANGGNTGVWDFYPELLGASVRQSPNHVDGTPLYAMAHIGSHASTAGLPDPWEKNEEYYYWEGGYYRPDNVEVLRVEETAGPNGEVNPYDAPRPMSWYRELHNNGRVFYTALGHAASNYTDDALFRQHIDQALAWLLEGATAVADLQKPVLRTFPNPADEAVQLPGWPAGEVRVLDVAGRVVKRMFMVSILSMDRMDTMDLPNGTYVLRASDGRCARVQVLH